MQETCIFHKKIGVDNVFRNLRNQIWILTSIDQK